MVRLADMEEMHMRQLKIGRRGLVSAAALTAAAAFAFGQPSFAQAPKSPQVINVVDVGGALALLQDAIEAYKTKNPTYVSRFTFTKAPAPELPGKLKAMQAANRSDIELVLGGLDGGGRRGHPRDPESDRAPRGALLRTRRNFPA